MSQQVELEPVSVQHASAIQVLATSHPDIVYQEVSLYKTRLYGNSLKRNCYGTIKTLEGSYYWQCQ